MALVNAWKEEEIHGEERGEKKACYLSHYVGKTGRRKVKERKERRRKEGRGEGEGSV